VTEKPGQAWVSRAAGLFVHLTRITKNDGQRIEYTYGGAGRVTVQRRAQAETTGAAMGGRHTGMMDSGTS
jgi:YD repeat-containing protein